MRSTRIRTIAASIHGLLDHEPLGSNGRTRRRDSCARSVSVRNAGAARPAWSVVSRKNDHSVLPIGRARGGAVQIRSGSASTRRTSAPRSEVWASVSRMRLQCGREISVWGKPRRAMAEPPGGHRARLPAADPASFGFRYSITYPARSGMRPDPTTPKFMESRHGRQYAGPFQLRHMERIPGARSSELAANSSLLKMTLGPAKDENRRGNGLYGRPPFAVTQGSAARPLHAMPSTGMQARLPCQKQRCLQSLQRVHGCGSSVIRRERRDACPIP